MKRFLIVLLLSCASFAQTRINPSQIRAPSGTASVTQFLICVPSGTCAWAQAGVVPNPQTGTSYTIVATDRMKYLSFSNGSAIAVTLPQAGSSGFANNYTFVACNIGAGTATITPTTSTISSSNGSSYTAAAATLALTTGQCAWIYSDNTNYFAIVRTAGGTTINATNNVIPKRSSATAFADSALTDNGTTVTSTEPIAGPNGTAGAPTFVGGSSNSGVFFSGTDVLLSANGVARLGAISGLGTEIRQGDWYTFSSAGDVTSTPQSTIASPSAKIFKFGAAGDNTGGVVASYHQSAGTKFTASGCTNSTTVGGATAGTFVSGTTGTCTVTITMGDSDTAPTGWACFASDRTTTANIYDQSASTTTTATLTGTTVSGDVISFGCIAY